MYVVVVDAGWCGWEGVASGCYTGAAFSKKEGTEETLRTLRGRNPVAIGQLVFVQKEIKEARNSRLIPRKPTTCPAIAVSQTGMAKRW